MLSICCYVLQAFLSKQLAVKPQFNIEFPTPPPPPAEQSVQRVCMYPISKKTDPLIEGPSDWARDAGYNTVKGTMSDNYGR